MMIGMIGRDAEAEFLEGALIEHAEKQKRQ